MCSFRFYQPFKISFEFFYDVTGKQRLCILYGRAVLQHGFHHNKSEEILQSLSGDNLDISKCINSIFFRGGGLYSDNFFQDNPRTEIFDDVIETNQ